MLSNLRLCFKMAKLLKEVGIYNAGPQVNTINEQRKNMDQRVNALVGLCPMIGMDIDVLWGFGKDDLFEKAKKCEEFTNKILEAYENPEFSQFVERFIDSEDVTPEDIHAILIAIKLQTQSLQSVIRNTDARVMQFIDDIRME